MIKDKKVTGFSNAEESQAQLTDHVPFLTETELEKRGAKYQKGKEWTEFAVEDNRVITGQNPQSGKAVGELVVKNKQ